ncbi:hypothetical protein SEA_SKOG_124 [Gordonia phage Skog]|uniref:Uncharacterized protein n=1 Tax=Gordonia phage Skog TaxID=2704033 RepID=A0A6G6XJS2_9CAUD|nr:hypothetical protein KHQ85_gp124 [Gordonia phage Skog]QIG58276.1 hypothetical protein SEA_SKOG_124 [Gordonia phage Skog]
MKPLHERVGAWLFDKHGKVVDAVCIALAASGLTASVIYLVAT